MRRNSRLEKSINKSAAIRRLLLGLTFVVGVMAAGAGFAVVVSAQRPQGRVVNANAFRGKDLGEKINAADRALSSGRGEIIVKGGGTISTQVIISSGHVLRFYRELMPPALPTFRY